MNAYFKDREKSTGAKVEGITAVIDLPEPKHFGEHSIEEVLLKRRSVRSYADQPLSLGDISQLLWAAQGLTGMRAREQRRWPERSIHFSIYLVAAKVNELPAAVYRYDSVYHSLIRIEDGDKRKQLYGAALMQGALRHCAAILVFAADYRPVMMKYFEKAKRYVHMEVGHAAQNVCLQAVSLGIGTVMMGAFLSTAVKKVLQLRANEEPLYLMPLGKSQ